MKSKILKTFFTLAILGVCAFTGTNSFANERPQVYYSGQVVYAGTDMSVDGYGKKICNKEVAEAVGGLISNRIKQLKGTLPFDLVQLDNTQNNDIKSKIAAETSSYICLVPVVLSDAVKCDTFDYNNKTWYKYDVRTMLSLMFCLKEDDGIHMAYNIPIYCYGMLGNELEHGLNSADPELLKAVETKYLKEQFKLNAETALKELTIPANMGKFLKDKKLMKTPSQVVQVKVAKNTEQKLRTRYDLDEVKKIAARAFTSAYLAKHPNTILLPDGVSENGWKERVAKYLDHNLSESDWADKEVNIKAIELNIASYTETTKVNAWDVIWTIGTGINYTLNGKTVASKPSVRTYRVPKDIKSNVFLNTEAIFADAAIQAAQK